MPNEELIILKKSEAEEFFLQVLKKHDDAKCEKNMLSLSVNQVAKKLHRHSSTIKKLITSGQIAATSDNRILITELNRYAAGEKKGFRHGQD